MFPGATGRRARGKESQGGVGKPLPGWWDKATTPKSCRQRTNGLEKFEIKQSLKDGWEGQQNSPLRKPTNIPAELLSLCHSLHACRSSRTKEKATTKPQPQPQKTQTVDLSAQRFFFSEVLHVLEPRAWTMLKLIHQFWQSLLHRLVVIVESGCQSWWGFGCLTAICS